MNERIKELHDKAFDGIDILEPNWFLKHNKKFAELIVRECANICHSLAYQASNSDGAVERKNCAFAIEEYFGVE